jgi:NAD+ dependent glucose-6-phosphate dehydrogenase
MTQPILITGASGYLGGFVVQALAGTAPLRLFDRVPPANLPVGAEFRAGDVADLPGLEAAMQGCAAVVHLVALVRGREQRPLADFERVMVHGTWNLFEAAVHCQVGRVVNCSSIVAGRFQGDRRNRVSDPPEYAAGDLRYALGKALGEEMGRAYHVAYGLPVIHIRPGIIAGDGANPGPAAPAAAAGLWFLYVDPRDVAGAIARALAADAPTYGTFAILADRPDTTIDLTATREQLGYQPRFNWPEIPVTESHP